MSTRFRHVGATLAPVLMLLSAPAPAADDFLWNEAGGCRDYRGTKLFVETYPDSPRAEEGRECLRRWDAEATEWKKVGNCRDIAKVRQFERNHPGSRYAEEARECIAWGEARACEDIRIVKQFVEDFPEGRYVGAANACVAILEMAQQRNSRVAALLRECRAHHDADRLTAGAGGSALECYRKVLDEEPGNQQALDGIASIEKHYTDKANASLRDETPEAVDSSIKRLETINPEHRMVEKLRARLEDLRLALAERTRLAGEREALRAEVESLLGQGSHEQALARLQEGSKRGLSDKSLQALEEQAREGLADAEARRKQEAEAEARRQTAAMIAEVRELLGRGDFSGARARLGEAREEGLGDDAHAGLAAAIDEAEAEAREREIEALVAEVRARLAREEHEAARRALDEARAAGLGEETHAELAAAIDEAETAQLLAGCEEHRASGRWEELQQCAHRVLALNADHAGARKLATMGARRLAWNAVEGAPSVEGYHEFRQRYRAHFLARLARQKLERMEDAYWEWVEATNTPDAYRRYLEIYPQGKYVEQARARN